MSVSNKTKTFTNTQKTRTHTTQTKQTHIKHKIIEKEEYRTHDTLPMDSTNYSIHGFDPTMILPDEPVYKTKEKEKKQGQSGLEEFMED